MRGGAGEPPWSAAGTTSDRAGSAGAPARWSGLADAEGTVASTAAGGGRRPAQPSATKATLTLTRGGDVIAVSHSRPVDGLNVGAMEAAAPIPVLGFPRRAGSPHFGEMTMSRTGG